MAVRPIDSLTMLPRLSEAGRLLHQNEQHPYAFQQVLGSQIQEKADRERLQVKAKAEVEQQAIQKEKQGGGNGQGSQSQGERQPQKAPETAPRRAHKAPGRLDVRV